MSYWKKFNVQPMKQIEMQITEVENTLPVAAFTVIPNAAIRYHQPTEGMYCLTFDLHVLRFLSLVPGAKYWYKVQVVPRTVDLSARAGFKYDISDKSLPISMVQQQFISISVANLITEQHTINELYYKMSLSFAVAEEFKKTWLISEDDFNDGQREPIQIEPPKKKK